MREAKNIYLIGFGFDEENIHRIGLPSVLENKSSLYSEIKNLYLLNYAGQMTNLKEEFERLVNLFPQKYGTLRIIESKANSIENALTLDLKKMWGINDILSSAIVSQKAEAVTR